MKIPLAMCQQEKCKDALTVELIRIVNQENQFMAINKRPGESTGKNGGIFQETGPKGGLKPNFATVADNKPLPPTSKPNSFWTPVKTTPNSKR